MRRAAAVLFPLLVLTVSCKGSGGGGSAAGSTPAAPADREAVYLQLEVAVAGDAEPAALLAGKLAKGESLGGGVRWRPIASALPKLAAHAPAISADVYEDPGWVSIAFRGAAAPAQGGAAGELASLLASAASRPESRGAALYLLDDADGSVRGVLAIAGHDAAEAAMALLDAWAPQLELSYAPEGLAEEGDVDRSRVTAALRVIDVETALERAPGARVSRDGGTTLVTFAPGSDTRSFAVSLASRVARTAAPATAGTAGNATSTGAPAASGKPEPGAPGAKTP